MFFINVSRLEDYGCESLELKATSETLDKGVAKAKSIAENYRKHNYTNWDYVEVSTPDIKDGLIEDWNIHYQIAWRGGEKFYE